MHTHGIQRRALLKAGAAAGLASLVPSCGRQSEPSVPVPVPQTEISAPSSGGALRVDLLHSFDGDRNAHGNKPEVTKPAWSGPTRARADELGWGDYRISVYDANTQQVVFRSGFDSTVSAESGESTGRISVRFPMPSSECEVVIERRRTRTAFQRLWRRSIAPSLVEIDRTAVKLATLVDVLVENGPPGAKVDLTMLAEGYRDIGPASSSPMQNRTLSRVFAVEPFERGYRFSTFAASSLRDGQRRN